MKFYSEVTNKLYDSQEALNKVEQAVKDADAQKQKRLDEVNAAIKDYEKFVKITQAKKEKKDALLNQYKKDFGAPTTEKEKISQDEVDEFIDFLTSIFGPLEK